MSRPLFVYIPVPRWVSVPKLFSQIQRSTFPPFQEASHTPSFGGLGLDSLCLPSPNTEQPRRLLWIISNISIRSFEGNPRL